VHVSTVAHSHTVLLLRYVGVACVSVTACM
jgi:hypothetical protein